MRYELQKTGQIWQGYAVNGNGEGIFGTSVISFDGKKLYHLFSPEIYELTDKQKQIAVKSDPSLKYALYEF